GRRDEEQVGERGGPARGHRSAEVVADEGCRGGEPTGLWWVDGRIPALLGDPAVVASGAPVRIVELDCHVDAGVRPADVRDDWVRRRTRESPVVEGDAEDAVRGGEDLLLEGVACRRRVVHLDRFRPGPTFIARPGEPDVPSRD